MLKCAFYEKEITPPLECEMPGYFNPRPAEDVKDRAAMKFLDWYIDEQVEEEASVDGVLSTLKLIGDDKNALLLLDKDLATRTFVAPVIG